LRSVPEESEEKKIRRLTCLVINPNLHSYFLIRDNTCFYRYFGEIMTQITRRRKVMVFLLALIGMVCWGIAPIFVKVGLKDINPLVGLSIRTLISGTVIFGWMFLDGSISQFKNTSLVVVGFLALEAIFAIIIGDLAYFTAIKMGSVSMVSVIMASAPVITIICAALFLGESITLIKFFGACLVVLGIILVV
jgi:bacterial/archaeal transporter family protein